MLNLFHFTKAEAQAEGYTHQGTLFGVPIWIGDVHTPTPKATAKLLPLNLVLLGITNLRFLYWEVAYGELPNYPIAHMEPIR